MAADTEAPDPWDPVASPNVGFATSRLTAVDCISPSDCWALGNSFPGLTTVASMAHWTGGEWSLVPAPAQPGKLTYMYDVACTSASDCFAVGLISNAGEFIGGGATTLYIHGVVFHWDGTAWSLDELGPAHGIPASANAVLRTVECPAVGDCWAVGFVNEGGQPHNLFLHWDGTAWSRAAVDAELGLGNLELGSLACTSIDFCMAVGPFRDGLVVSAPRAPSAAIWDGDAWRVAPSPVNHSLADDGLPATFGHWLNGVSCVASDDCWAVGDADVEEATGLATSLPLVEQWDGTGWTSTVLPAAPFDVPAAPGGLENHLTAVSCVSGDDCWAVGHANSDAAMPGAQVRDLLLHWDGSAWLPAPALPTPEATFGGTLASIDCPSAARCWAVGQITPSGQYHSLIQGWDGRAWTAVAAPEPAASVGNYLRDVMCAAPGDCWAVGMYFHGQLGRTLILHGDGTTWSVVDSPNSALDRYNGLTGVSCASASDCWAVGSSSTWLGQHSQPITLHWDGEAWAFVDPFAVPVDVVMTTLNDAQPVVYAFEEARLQSVHCTSATDCWAVGSVLAAAGQAGSFLVGATYYHKPLFLHWDGRTWEPVIGPPTQVEPLTEYHLHDVTCLSADDCTAVGSTFARLEYNFIEGPDAQTLIEHWDGVRWSEVASPNVGDFINQLFGVSCVADTCLAVGYYYVDYPYSGSPRTAPLALRLGPGGAWHTETLPDGTAPLIDIHCLAADDCWAVGSPPGLNAPTSVTAVHWDGAAWMHAPSPTIQIDGQLAASNLAGLSCTTTDCWAVGQARSGPKTQTLVLRADAAADCFFDCFDAGPLATTCSPHFRSQVAVEDRDGDGIAGVYLTRRTVTADVGDGTEVHDDGGDCWIAGDPDDDGTTRPVEPPAVLPPVAVCAPSPRPGAGVDLADKDGDGLPALYTNQRSLVVTIGGDAWVGVAGSDEACWLAGDIE